MANARQVFTHAKQLVENPDTGEPETMDGNVVNAGATVMEAPKREHEEAKKLKPFRKLSRRNMMT